MKNIKKLNSRKIGIGPMSSEVIEAVYKYSSINNKELMLIASKNQIDSFKEPRRMKWSWLWLKYGKNKKESNIIEGQSEEVTEDDERPFDFRD